MVEHRGLVSYLWADGHEEVVRALLRELPPSTLHQMLRYLVKRDFARRRGWPSALVAGPQGWRFVLVLHSKSRLSDEQRRWVEDKHREAQWPFELVRVGPARRARRAPPARCPAAHEPADEASR